MATPKISSLLVALIWVSFFASVFGIFIANMTSSYDVNYNTSDIEIFNRLDELNAESQSYKNSSLSFKENTGIFDVIGGYFSNGYKTMKITLSSLDIFNKMTNAALSTPGLNIPGMQYLNTAIILTVLILIIIGVMLSAILKKDV